MNASTGVPIACRALVWVIVGFVAAALSVAAPLGLPLILATWVAVILRPAVEKMARVLRGRTRAAALVMVLLLLLLLLPIVGIVLSLSFSAVDFVHRILSSEGGRSALSKLVLDRPDGHGLNLSLDSLLRIAEQYGARAWSLLSRIAGATATGVVGLFIFFLGIYTLMVDGRRAWAWAEEHTPIPRLHLARLAAAFHETGRGLLLGVGLTGLTQGIVATVAYLALGIPSAFVLGLLTAFGALIPSVGTAIVWVPVAAGLLITGRIVSGLVLLGIGFLFIGLIDNLVRPLFSRFGRLRLPTFILFIAIFGGIALFGASGVLLGPLAMRMGLEAAEIFRDEEGFGSAGESAAKERA